MREAGCPGCVRTPAAVSDGEARRGVREKVAVDDAGDARANRVSLMDVAVLGAGGGGLAVAYEWASQGHRVSLYAQRAHDHHLAPVRERGGMQVRARWRGSSPWRR
jgi:NADPH-dependent 2,4-dienoyl-CoA reductase/sulfur reductase-like enzyme